MAIGGSGFTDSFCYHFSGRQRVFCSVGLAGFSQSIPGKSCAVQRPRFHLAVAPLLRPVALLLHPVALLLAGICAVSSLTAAPSKELALPLFQSQPLFVSDAQSAVRETGVAHTDMHSL